MVCFKAPYFATISPTYLAFAPGEVEVRVRKRRRVTNHIGTVHAIAMANACELAAGTMTEISIPAGMRWIPKGMTIAYLKKADTDVRARARLATPVEPGLRQDVVVPVDVLNDSDDVVVHADITMYVSPRSR